MDCIYNSPGSFHYGPGDHELVIHLSDPNNSFNIAPNVGPVIHRGLMDIARKSNRSYYTQCCFKSRSLY